MIYKLLFDHKKYLNFYFDEDQLQSLLGKRTRENFNKYINYYNAPVQFHEVFKEPLNFNFSSTHKDDEEKDIADLCVAAGRLFMSEKAYKHLQPLIKNDGEFLQVSYQKGKGYFFNPLQSVAIDPKQSRRDEWEEIISLGFNTNDIKDFLIFRTEFDYYRGLYCQKPIKQAIENNNLTGLYITTDLASIFPEDRSSVEKSN
ncbi:hypothetical protein [Aliikangiella sp. IMCC44359]|uniref:hypothetical protein n=1 Tax=Aliikangiella sp. IMCC44359 TaxID=3459125 RepID=UPI00403AB08A